MDLLAAATEALQGRARLLGLDKKTPKSELNFSTPPPKLPTLHVPALAPLGHGGEDPGVVVARLHGQAAPVPLLLPDLLQLYRISDRSSDFLRLRL